MASRYSSCASITQIRAPISPKMASRSKDGSRKSTCPGKSQTWKSMKELKDVSSCEKLERRHLLHRVFLYSCGRLEK